MDLKGKTILITGASSGIGKAIAEEFAKYKTNIAVGYANNRSEATEVISKIGESESKSIVVQCDITSDNSVKQAIDIVEKEYGNLDILINNAGIFDESDSPENIDSFRNDFEVNFFGQIRMTNEALKLMKKGKIIFISSIHGRIGHGRPGAIAYSASKAALDSYMKNLAKYLAPNILVNSIAPGKVETPMWGEMDTDFMKEQSKDHLIERWIKPEEIADAASFIIQNDAMCGEILTIDGGMGIKTLG